MQASSDNRGQRPNTLNTIVFNRWNIYEGGIVSAYSWNTILYRQLDMLRCLEIGPFDRVWIVVQVLVHVPCDKSLHKNNTQTYITLPPVCTKKKQINVYQIVNAFHILDHIVNYIQNSTYGFY